MLIRGSRRTLASCGALAAFAAFAVSLFVPRAALAASGDPCANLTGEDNAVTKIYIENGDTQEPMLKKLGKLLMQSNDKLRIIYRNRPTCEIRASLFTGAQMLTIATPTARPVRYIPGDPSFDPQAAAPTCTVPDAAPGPEITLGIGATYLSSCAANPTQPADVAVLEGPIQAYGFITHKNSAQLAITAEEGYLAYGFAEGAGDAQPWVVQNLRFKRGNTASTTLTMSSAIRLKPSEMKAAADSSTSDLLISSVQNGTPPDQLLGVLGTELFDQHRNDIKLLAFKSFGQKLAYFPDKTSASFDKQNVRDGHYLPWSPTPYIAKATNDVFNDANAKRIYDLVMGNVDETGLIHVISSGLIPKCAMKVDRAGDGADLTLYSSPTPCGCYFEKHVPQGTTACTACTVGNDAPCNGGKCRYGYCEAK